MSVDKENITDNNESDNYNMVDSSSNTSYWYLYSMDNALSYGSTEG